MLSFRNYHTGLLLSNGKVLVVGGYSTFTPSGTPPTATAELYEP